MSFQTVLSRPASTVRLRVPRLRLGLGTLVCTLVLVLVGLLVVYPVLLLVAHSFEVGVFGRETHFGFDNWVRALTEPQLVNAIWNTVSLAVTRQVLALGLAVGIAWLLGSTDLPGARWLEFGCWVTVFLPNLTVLVAWIMLFDGFNGLANQVLQKLPFVAGPVFDIYTWWGIVAAHLLSGSIAVGVMLLTPAFRNLDSSLEEASLTSGAGSVETLVRIVVPILAPSILVVAILSTIRALESFETELILGAPQRLDVFSTRIFRMAQREPPEYGVATALSMAVLLLMLPAILFQQWYSGRRSFTTVGSKFSKRADALASLALAAVRAGCLDDRVDERCTRGPGQHGHVHVAVWLLQCGSGVDVEELAGCAWQPHVHPRHDQHADHRDWQSAVGDAHVHGHRLHRRPHNVRRPSTAGLSRVAALDNSRRDS